MPRQDTIFERFISPVFGFLMDRDAIDRLDRSIDWDAARDRLSDPDLTYPDYYKSQNFHGIEGGYLTKGAALTYDPVTRYALPPSEIWVRQAGIDAIDVRPRRILDLGCGTGSTTLLLKKAFPAAEVIGLDLSPEMLAVAETKAKREGMEIQFRHGLAERTGFPEESFDLVSAALLFHETPPDIARAVLREAFRLLKAGGQVVVLDGHQRVLRHTEWLTEIFEEPYVKDYAAGSVDAWLGAAGFGAVRTEDVWWTNQVSLGVKPIRDPAPEVNFGWEAAENPGGFPAPA
ncbi:class I SAM-dependent methyltransferase [Lyngbya sp. CCY1209]|uniref:class I SAM-dependent methyltransferase n=1 Tax=Lyngbya sp. CCY1209 TaxID=2886103 RepID=UPI002D1FD50D|nr:class I SAM-dependent methyltransferase [Lyngbya sp. CCY1209]MEB3887491.1 class I SAM-dependent methyltransferase [Lyngbya sp. CCY1209]